MIGPNVKAMQSMLFIKAEGKPGQAWHQDEYFIPTRDRSLTAVWIALDDATVENGCLWVLPGSHRRGVLYPARDQDDPRFDCTIEAYDFPYRDEDAVPVEVPAGTALIFNGYLLHRSLPNTGRHGYRRALVNHYMSAESLLPWRAPARASTWRSRTTATSSWWPGEDPYAYKGTSTSPAPTSARTRTAAATADGGRGTAAPAVQRQGRSIGRSTRSMPCAICLLPLLMSNLMTRGSRSLRSASTSLTRFHQ